jgi:ferredoxin/flavodoxin
MILFFSGTGNSRFVAESLAKLLKDNCVSISEVLRGDSVLSLSDNERLGFVFPVYSWGVPPIVIRLIGQMKLAVKPRYIYFVCTCGDETALAPQQFVSSLERRGLHCSAGYSVIMPNNYVLLPGFDVDPVAVSDSKLLKAPERIAYIVERIESGAEEVDCTVGPMAWVKSKLVYPLFVRWGVFPKKFHTTEMCNGCGKCSRACPVRNITMSDGHPLWGPDCTSCVACYHVCPQHAVQYGGFTKGKGQYYHK